MARHSGWFGSSRAASSWGVPETAAQPGQVWQTGSRSASGQTAAQTSGGAKPWHAGRCEVASKQLSEQRDSRLYGRAVVCRGGCSVRVHLESYIRELRSKYWPRGWGGGGFGSEGVTSGTCASVRAGIGGGGGRGGGGGGGGAREAGLSAFWCTLDALHDHFAYHAVSLAFQRISALTTIGEHGAGKGRRRHYAPPCCALPCLPPVSASLCAHPAPPVRRSASCGHSRKGPGVDGD
jgi:hypothetical protein